MLQVSMASMNISSEMRTYNDRSRNQRHMSLQIRPQISWIEGLAKGVSFVDLKLRFNNEFGLAICLTRLTIPFFLNRFAISDERRMFPAFDWA